MLRFHYTCPDTEEPIGISIAVETIDEAEEALHIEKCPRCGDEHYLSLDDLHPDSNGEGLSHAAP